MIDQLLTIEEVADLLKVNPRTVHRYANQGLLPCVRFTKKTVRFKREDVLRFIEIHHREGRFERTASRILSRITGN